MVSHPTLPLTITAHEDRHIRFWDNHTGQLVQSMVAHLDSVTSLATDANGLYLLSGSKYPWPCSGCRVLLGSSNIFLLKLTASRSGSVRRVSFSVRTLPLPAGHLHLKYTS